MTLASSVSKSLIEQLRLEIFKAAHSVSAVFGDDYDFKFNKDIIEHRFVNQDLDAVPLSWVVQGKNLKTPVALSEIGALSAERMFCQSFAGDNHVGWYGATSQVRTRDAMDPVFKMIARNAQHLMVACSVQHCPLTYALRYDLYVETKGLGLKDKTSMYVTIRDADLSRVKGTAHNPFAY